MSLLFTISLKNYSTEYIRNIFKKESNSFHYLFHKKYIFS